MKTPFEKLVDVMARLRAPGGCPWDREQDHATLKTYLIEEAYEVIEAIDANDPAKLEEELGDLLLQPVFHAEIARERGQFDINDVINALIEKLVRRHPHVFGDVKLGTAEQVLTQWHKIKRGEKKAARSAIDGVPKHLPALQKAHKLQKKAARVGFDWKHIDEVMAKVDEELAEVKEALLARKKKAVHEEIGDLLFSVANLSRFLDLDPEDALRNTINKFSRRFKMIERELGRRGKKLEESSLEEMDAIWNAAKKKPPRAGARRRPST
ncbi:MAG TPA: nucleoside triphosphate pyrophosphohydrolase [bacterium]|nr:nucleoside triphosphate pyrophosphohydrolase [bacterium]